jgi:hypothetical protein
MSTEKDGKETNVNYCYWLKTYLTLVIAIVPSLILFFVENRYAIIILLIINFVIIALYFGLIFFRTVIPGFSTHEKSILKELIFFLIIFYLVLTYWFGVIHYKLFRLNCDAYHVENLTDYPYIDFLYFSVVTVTTLGYGDISPASVIPKLLSIVQVITGWIYIVFIIAFTISALSRKE